MVATSSEEDRLVGSPGVPGYYNSGNSRFAPRQNPYFIVSQSERPDEYQLNFTSVIEVTYQRDFIAPKYQEFQSIVDDRQVSLIALIAGRRFLLHMAIHLKTTPSKKLVIGPCRSVTHCRLLMSRTKVV